MVLAPKNVRTLKVGLDIHLRLTIKSIVVTLSVLLCAVALNVFWSRMLYAFAAVFFLAGISRIVGKIAILSQIEFAHVMLKPQCGFRNYEVWTGGRQSRGIPSLCRYHDGLSARYDTESCRIIGACLLSCRRGPYRPSGRPCRPSSGSGWSGLPGRSR